MEALNIEIVNPKAKGLLLSLAEMELIQIKPRSVVTDMLAKMRRNESQVPSLDEITQEVETIRSAGYARKVKGNY